MNLTRRGAVVVAAAVVGVILGASFGARSLDVVVVPAVAVLAFALGQVTLADRPTVERTSTEPGMPGDTRTIGLQIETDAMATVTDRIDGVSPETVEMAVSDDGSVEYDVTFIRRGVHSVGPLSVTVCDPLGLVTERYQYTDFDPILVYPDIHQIAATDVFATLTGGDGVPERQEFQGLREYTPGESLRNVHWKTSAKQQDLFVVEHTRESESSVSVVAESLSGAENADAMARAAASIVCFLLRNGVNVGLTVPNSRLEHTQTTTRQSVLEFFAKATSGRVPTARTESADVCVRGERGHAVVEIDGHQIPFDRLVDYRHSGRRSSEPALHAVDTTPGGNS
ncbi:DUF58 domain-containing protein [Halocatena pleomorpha]|uniref:DUF58 domain-containing protein n=1 Tax=Halocatena pleomorpha TaxID=1785090 RepID=A0A3P3R8A7_9EURY|nr:DUF58 domain-containing protein [Halocatena pleomorpha]RRJ29159.1 DUF58 domain-containing protein [Halocatena pleomorpha]